MARDVDRADWRSFRVDRLLDVEATGHRIAIDDPPDPVAVVQAAITTRADRYQARVEVAPVDDVAPLVPPNTGILEPIDERRTMLTTGGDDLDVIVFHLLTIGVDLVIHEPPALRRHVATAARRLAGAVR